MFMSDCRSTLLISSEYLICGVPTREVPIRLLARRKARAPRFRREQSTEHRRHSFCLQLAPRPPGLQEPAAQGMTDRAVAAGQGAPRFPGRVNGGWCGDRQTRPRPSRGRKHRRAAQSSVTSGCRPAGAGAWSPPTARVPAPRLHATNHSPAPHVPRRFRCLLCCRCGWLRSR